MSYSLRSTILSIALVVCLVAAAEPAAAQAKLLTVPDTTAKKGDTLLVPLRISSLATLDSVYSGQFTLSYNSGVMYIYDISTAGTLLAGTGNVSFNPTTRQLAFASGTIITGTGPLIYLKVATSASPSSLTDVISVTSAVFNEGTPAITIHNGNFRFRTITISPKTPPGNLVVGDSLQFSVSGDQIPPLTWTSSNPSFATIDANGKLRGVGVGQLTVYVQDSQGLRDSTNLFPINSALLNSLTLSLHDTSYTQTLSFNLPIYISDVTGLGIISSQFTLTFNSSILQALDVIKAGSMSSTWTAPAYNISGGRIDVALAGGQPLTSAGVLVYVRFKVLPTASGSTAIALSSALFNETIHASLVNGNFGTIAAPILIIAPATGILTKGDTTTFRVTSGGHPPYSWTSNTPSVATINNTTGLLTALARGTTTVTVVDSLGFTATSGSIAVNDLRVSLPDTSVNIADSVDVPITTDLLTGLGIYSYDFRLVYDSTVVKIAQVLTAGTLSSGMTIAVRDTVDTLRVGAAGSAPLSGTGTLLKIRFKAAPGVSLSQLSNTRFAFFNFNEPGLGTATATPRNGSITIGNVLPSAPAAPTLLSPTTAATGVAVAPTLSWNASTGATSYTLQLATNSSFTSILIQQPGIAATTYNPTGLVNNTPYYWRVSATNAGGTSAYSTGFSFTTIIAAPPPPSLVSPPSATTGVSLTPTLSWNAASTATSYTVQVSTDPAFGSFVINQAGIASTSYVAGGLSGTTTYYWRVSGTNVGGTGNNSSVFNFTTGSGAPAVPVLSSPHDTATAIALSPTLSWNAVTGATSYTLQVSTASDFSALVVNQSGITGVSSSIGPLTASTLYYWRVSATNASGTSAYATAFRFTTAVAPPAAPTLLSPTTAATGVAVAPTLSWNASATATSYTIQISTDSTFSTSLVNQSGIAGTSYGATGLAGSTRYFWRVSAANAGGSSAFSSSFSFTTTLSPPAAPTLVSPVNGAVLVSVTPTLSWNPSAGAASYALQISPAADFSALIVNQSGIVGTSVPVSGLSNSTVYYWRVSASNAGGTSSYSSTFSFTTIIAPPAAPVLLSPHDTATGVAISPSFTWNTSPTATSYAIQVSTSPSFASFVVNVSGITATSYNAFGLGGNGTFYWRVAATNAGGTGSFSAPFSFSTILSAPLAPTLVSPANSATGVSINPTLSWNASLAATSYLLEISTAPDFSSLLVLQSGITATSYNASGLLPNTQYYWRVSAANAAGGGSLSSAFAFTTGIAPATPALILPANGAIGVSPANPTLVWHSSATATSYTLQVSTTANMSALVVNQSNITDTSFTLGLLNFGTPYYWAVRAANAGGQSGFSAVYSFTTIVSPPQAPTLISPANGAIGVSPANPTLVWHSSATATSYTLQVSTTANMSSLLVNQSNITDTSFTLGLLNFGTPYYWAVRPTNAGGQGGFSAIYSFATIVSPPLAPTLISPANGAISVSPTNHPILVWHPSAGAASYTVEVSTAANMSALVVNQSNITDTSFTLGLLDFGTQYYWAVRPANAGGQGGFSAIYSFTTTAYPPQAPTLISPANGAISVSPSNPTLVWHSSATATSYTLLVSTTADMSALVVNQSNIIDTSFTLGLLNFGTPYYWAVRPANAGGQGGFSIVSSFTTIVYPPQAPTLISPANGAISVSPSNPTLVWHPSATATSYTLQVSTAANMSALVVNQSNITDTSFTLGLLNTGTQYYWAVRPANAGGQGGFSTIFSFTTTATPPQAPTLISPANGALDVSVPSPLYWNTFPGALSYSVQLSTVANFSTLVLTQSGITDTSLNVKTLNWKTLYYWRVSATTAAGVSPFSSTFSFTTHLGDPQNISPHDTATGLSLNPTLTWAPISGATSYTLQVSASTDFSTGIVNQSGITTTSRTIGPLTPNTLYYWRVNATDGNYTTIFSPRWSFTTIVPPPAAPTLVSPADASTDLVTTQTLSWNASPTATLYSIQISIDPGFSSFVVNQSGLSGTSYVTSGLTVNTHYYWRVNASNAGGTSPFSTAFSFTTIAAVPSVPRLVSPANGAIDVSSSLIWNASPKATSYTLQVSTVANFSTLVVNQSGLTDTAYGKVLNGKTLYYWRVSATNAVGTSAYSNAFSFTTHLGDPQLISPHDTATGVSLNPTLSWAPISGATSYTLQVSTTTDLSSGIVNQSGITTTSRTIGPLTPNTLYYWWVNATDGNYTTIFSLRWSFRTIVAPPATPTLVSPADASTDLFTNPTLSWNASPTATSYSIQISIDPGFSSFVVNQSGLSGTSYVTSGLTVNTHYYWRVNASNAGGTSPFSTAFSFTTIATVPSVPRLVSPANGAIDVSSSLIWNASPKATSYTLQVSTAANFSTLVVNLSGFADTAYGSALSGKTLYYWRVSATNAVGTSAYSNAFSFTTHLGDPQLISPHDTATGVSLNPTLSWAPIGGATSYTLQVSTTLDLSSGIVNQSGITTTSRTIGPLTPNTLYYWWVNATDGNYTTIFSLRWSFRTRNATTAVEMTSGTGPEVYTLSQNYPNPFNPSTMVPFSLPHRSIVRVSVCSLLGTEVAVLVNGERSAGSYEVRLDAGAFPSGIYLIRMQASPLEGGTGQPFVATKKVVLLK